MFDPNHLYTRREIAEKLGGNLQQYLPTVNGKVVCACLSTDLNPDAPRVILPGTGPTIEGTAYKLRQQETSVPVFVKEDTSAWRYHGLWRPIAREPTERDLKHFAEKTGRDDITTVIWMECTRPPDEGERKVVRRRRR